MATGLLENIILLDQMNRWLPLVIIIGSTIAIILPLSFITDKDTQPIIANYLFAGVIIEGIVIFMIQQIMDNKKHLQDRRERHTKDLYEIYKRIADVGFTEVKGKLELTFPRDYQEPKYDTFTLLENLNNYDPMEHRIKQKYLSMNKDYEYFDFALEHLKYKKYKNIYQHWEKASKLIDEYDNSPKFMDQLQQKIRNSISQIFPDFEEKKGISYFEHFFKMQTIADYIMNKIWYVKEYPPESLLNDLIVDRLTSGFDCICTSGAGGIDPHFGSIAKEKLDLEKYRTMLIAILTDKEICNSLEVENKKRHEITKEQDEFKKQLQILITKLKAGELIEGKCPIGF